MKNVKSFFGILLITALIISIGIITAFASEPTPTANGSIIVTNATAGQTYEAWLVFPAIPANASDLSEGVAYIATDEQIAIDGFTDVFDVFVVDGTTNMIAKKSTVEDAEVLAFIKNNIENLKQGNAISGIDSDNSTIVFNDLDYGYYYITSSLGTLITIDTAGINVRVVDKNESTPDGPEKIISAQDSAIDIGLDDISSNDGKTNDSSVGSVETFTVTFNAVNWVQASDNDAVAGTGDPAHKVQVTVWNFKDTPTGLEIDEESVHVFVNGTDSANEITSTINDIIVDANGVLTFSIPWIDTATGNSLYETETEGSALIPVTVIYNATVLKEAASAAALNTVDVKYNNDNELGNDTTTTYTYKFDLEKVDGNNNKLNGAEFELYLGTVVDDTAPALTFTLEDGKYRYDPNSTETHIIVTDGEASIIGLDNTKYMLREVVVPDGYNKADDQPVEGLTRVDMTSTSTLVSVKNNKGTELPSTGGIGTTIFYVIGGLLIVGAGVVLVTRKKTQDDR